MRECSDRGRVLDIADAALTTSLNLISSSLFSIDFAEFSSDSSQDLKGIAHGLMKIAGKPNIADFFPVLKPIDPQRVCRKSASYVRDLFRIFNDIIEQRVQKKDSEPRNGLLEALLDISRKNESELSRNDIVHLLLVSSIYIPFTFGSGIFG